MKLTITDLGKQYRSDLWGLRNFSLHIKPGILGLLGPNGAGKSTFMRMLATITKPTDGKILWNDVDIVKAPDTMRAVLIILAGLPGTGKTTIARELARRLVAVHIHVDAIELDL